MSKMEHFETAAVDHSDDIAHLGFGQRGYLHALSAVLMELPEMNEDGPFADAVGMQLKRMNDIAAELLSQKYGPAKTLKPLD